MRTRIFLTLVVSAIFMAPIASQAQSSTASKYANNRNVKTVTLSKGMALLMPEALRKQFNLGPIVDKVDKIQVLRPTRSITNRRMTLKARAEARRDYNEIMRFNRDNMIYSVNVKEEHGVITDAGLLISKRRPCKGSTLIVLKGKFAPEDLKRLLK